MSSKTGSSVVKGLAILIGTAAICTACSTAAQRQGQAIRKNSQAAVSTLNICMQAVYDSPEVAPLRAHIPAPRSQATLEQQTDPAFATDEEIKALFAEHPKANACRQQELDRLVQQTPSVVPILANGFSHIEQAMIGLVQKRTTWGEYTRQVKSIVEETRGRLAAEGQRIDANLEQSHEAELARRQAAINAIAQFAETEIAIAALNRPVVTTCNAYGNSATCVTR